MICIFLQIHRLSLYTLNFFFFHLQRNSFLCRSFILSILFIQAEHFQGLLSTYFSHVLKSGSIYIIGRKLAFEKISWEWRNGLKAINPFADLVLRTKFTWLKTTCSSAS